MNNIKKLKKINISIKNNKLLFWFGVFGYTIFVTMFIICIIKINYINLTVCLLVGVLLFGIIFCSNLLDSITKENIMLEILKEIKKVKRK